MRTEFEVSCHQNQIVEIDVVAVSETDDSEKVGVCTLHLTRTEALALVNEILTKMGEAK